RNGVSGGKVGRMGWVPGRERLQMSGGGCSARGLLARGIVSVWVGAMVGFGSGMARGESLPIQIDGRFEDWPASARMVIDAVGDGEVNVDLTALWIANDEQRLFLRLDFAEEIHADEGHDLTFYFDTDRDPNTGRLVRFRDGSALGAELIWNLGRRMGSEHVRGSGRTVDLRTFDLWIAPTVSGSSFEIALRRDALAGKQPIFAGPSFDLRILDGTTGDLLTLPVPGYTFAPGIQKVAPIPLARAGPDAIRIASYNIADDGLFVESRIEARERVFRAIDPELRVVRATW